MSPERLSARLGDAIAQLDETQGYILDPRDVAAISRVAADLAELKLEIEISIFRPELWVGLAQ